MKFRRLITLIVVAVLAFAPVAYAAGWEEIQRPRQQWEHIDAEDVDIAAHDGYVFVTASRSVSVKIFTILGQTVAQDTLKPGTYRFKLVAKGIYLIKIGSVTRRVTI